MTVASWKFSYRVNLCYQNLHLPRAFAVQDAMQDQGPVTKADMAVVAINSFGIFLGSLACITVRNSEPGIGNQNQHAWYMISAMWLIAIFVFSYFYVTRTPPTPMNIYETKMYFWLLFLTFFFNGPLSYCPLLTFLYWFFK